MKAAKTRRTRSNLTDHFRQFWIHRPSKTIEMPFDTACAWQSIRLRNRRVLKAEMNDKRCTRNLTQEWYTDPDSNTGKSRRSPIFRYSSDFRYCSCSWQTTYKLPSKSGSFLCPPGLFISFRDARQQEMQATTALEGHQVSAVPLGFKRTELKWKNFLLFRREKAGKVSFNIAK